MGFFGLSEVCDVSSRTHTTPVQVGITLSTGGTLFTNWLF